MSSLPPRVWRRVRRALGLPDDGIEGAVQLFGVAYPEAFFVQVGANDGVTFDPLRIEIERRNWRGIMVEPVPYVFKRLADKYGQHPRITLDQVAIADFDGKRPFYYLREARPGERVWHSYHSLGSFDRELLLRHRELIPDIEARLVEMEVSCVTFTSLCKRHQVAQVDLLQIDTEGCDHEILRSVDFKIWRPRLILYEHHHLSVEDRAATRGLLHRNHYLCFEDGLDTAALDTSGLGPENRRLRNHFQTTRDRPAIEDVR